MSNLTDYTRNKDTITSLIEAPLDRTLRATQSNLSSQAFVIDDSGILGRRYSSTDATNTTFDPKQVRIVNNTILFTADNWATASLALGEITLDDGTQTYGVVANTFVGKLFLGENMVIGDSKGLFTIDNTGIRILNGTNTVFNADTSGNLVLTGTINATSGTIGGFTITENAIFDGDKIDESKISLMKTGEFKATNANISGVINATSGSIGGFTIGALELDDGTEIAAIYDGETPDTSKVYMGSDGRFVATDALLSGEVTATYGRIGAFEFDKNGIYSARISLDSNIGSVSVNGSISTSGIVSSENSVRSKNIQTRRIQSSTKSGLYLDFDGVEAINTKEIYLSVTNFNITDKGSSGFLNIGWAAGNVDITISLKDVDGNSISLMNSKTITIILTYNNSKNNHLNTVTKNYTIEPGMSSVIVSVPNNQFFSYDVCTLRNNVVLSPETFIDNRGSNSNVIACSGGIVPLKDAEQELGSDNHKWKDVYGCNSMINTSDRSEKMEIEELGEKYSTLFDSLIPVTYKFISGTSGRKHTGLIAQDIKESLCYAGLDSNDFAAYCEWNKLDGQKGYGLRYGEFIALCIKEIQGLKKRISILEKIIN